jgi:hypothetical protein
MPGSASAQIALVSGQTVSGNSGFGSSPFTITLPNNPATGNLVVVSIAANSSVTGISIADANSNNYTAAAVLFAGSSRKLGIWYLIAPANANKAITVTITTPTGFTEAWAAEFSGAATSAPFESSATVSFAGPGTTVNLPSITTTNNGDLLIGLAVGYSTLTAAVAPWTAIATASGDNAWTEYYVKPTAGAQAIGFTQSASNNWDAMSAAFKSASGGGGGVVAARINLLGVGK